MRRPQPVCLALALMLAAVPVAHAQLGGLVKKKAADKITGKDTVAVAGKGAAKPKCDATSMVITSDVVSRYLKGLAAQDAMMEKLAKEPGPTGAYYAAVLKRQAIQQRKDVYDLHKGPDWEKKKVIQKRMMTGDTAAFREYHELETSLNPNKVELPNIEFETQQKGSARMDSTMKVAGGFSDCDWLGLSEKMPRMVYTLAADPNSKDFSGWGTEKEAAVIRPRIVELARAMHITYVSPEDKARLAKEEEEAKAVAAQPVSSGDPKTDCIMKVHTEYAKKHKAEMEKAQEAQDMTALMRHGMVMNAEANEQCNKE